MRTYDAAPVEAGLEFPSTSPCSQPRSLVPPRQSWCFCAIFSFLERTAPPTPCSGSTPRPLAPPSDNNLHARSIGVCVTFLLAPRLPETAGGVPVLQNTSNHVCMMLMDAVVAASSGKASGVPKVSMYDVRTYELGRQFPPGHRDVEVCMHCRAPPGFDCVVRGDRQARCVCLCAASHGLPLFFALGAWRKWCEHCACTDSRGAHHASPGRDSGCAPSVIYRSPCHERSRAFAFRASLCRSFQAYLNRDDVKAAIHASSCPTKFQECTDPPFIHLAK